MNFIWHQFIKDVRMTRAALGLFLGMLALDLAVSQEWLGAPTWEWPFWNARRGFNWQGWPALLAFGFGVGLLLAAIGQDSPTKEGGFLRTRPVPVRDIWIGKVVFVMLIIVLPALIQLATHLLLSGVAWPDFIGILGERVAAIAAVGLFFAGLFASAENPRSIQIMIAAIFVTFAITMGFLGGMAHLLRGAFGGSIDPEPSLLRGCWALTTAGIGLLAMSVWITRRRPTTARRIGVTCVVTAVAVTSAACLPKELPLAPAGDAAFAQALADTRFEIPPGGIHFNQTRTERAGEDRRHWQLRLEAPAADPAWQFEPQPATMAFTTAAGTRHEAPPNRFRQPVFGQRFYLEARALPAIREAMPQVNAFSIDGGMPGMGRISVSGGMLSLPTDEATWQQPGEFEASFVTRVFRWQQTADLALDERRIAPDGTGSWQVAASHFNTNSESWEIVLRRRQIWRHFTSDQERLAFPWWPADRYRFFLFDPETRTAISLRSNSQEYWKTGRHNGVGSSFLYLQHTRRDRNHGDLELGDPAGYRLLILKKIYLGETSRRVATKLMPAELRRPVAATTSNRDRLERPLMNRRFQALEAPPVKAGRARIARYVYDVLRIIDAGSHYLDPHDEMIRALARYVPHQLDLFLDGRDAAGSESRSALETALRQGLTETQKPDVIARLRQRPSLCWLVLARGWLDDCRAEVLSLIDHPRQLDRSARQALLLLIDEPGVRERLLAEFAAHPKADFLDQLSREPSLAGELDQIVRRLWRERVSVLNHQANPDDVLRVAMRHGLPAAHAEALRIFGLIRPSERHEAYSLLTALNESTQTGLQTRDQYNHKKLAARFSELLDREFRFDPDRRRFLPVAEN